MAFLAEADEHVVADIRFDAFLNREARRHAGSRPRSPRIRNFDRALHNYCKIAIGKKHRSPIAGYLFRTFREYVFAGRDLRRIVTRDELKGVAHYTFALIERRILTMAASGNVLEVRRGSRVCVLARFTDPASRQCVLTLDQGPEHLERVICLEPVKKFDRRTRIRSRRWDRGYNNRSRCGTR